MKDGKPLGTMPALYLEKTEKISESSERRLYFTMVYSISPEGIGASEVSLIEEEWTKTPGNRNTPQLYGR
ncbi:hypothetical protein FJZ53_03075 [Candidatus Woesearchaeota archaeon]|nr:hypothetical protein [Candidatus Woesearchaeota archaeon]